MKLLLSRALSQSPSKRLCSEDSHRAPSNSLHHISKNKAWQQKAESAAGYSCTALHQPQQQSGERNGLSWRTREYDICLQRSTGLEGNLTGAAWKTVWWANTSHQSESHNERDIGKHRDREKSSSRHFWKCAPYRLWGYHRAWASISTEKACGNSLLTVLHKYPDVRNWTSVNLITWHHPRVAHLDGDFCKVGTREAAETLQGKVVCCPPGA